MKQSTGPGEYLQPTISSASDAEVRNDEINNILSLNDELKKCYDNLQDERAKHLELEQKYMKLKNVYDYEENEYKVFRINFRI